MYVTHSWENCVKVVSATFQDICEIGKDILTAPKDVKVFVCLFIYLFICLFVCYLLLFVCLFVCCLLLLLFVCLFKDVNETNLFEIHMKWIHVYLFDLTFNLLVTEYTKQESVCCLFTPSSIPDVKRFPPKVYVVKIQQQTDSVCDVHLRCEIGYLFD